MILDMLADFPQLPRSRVLVDHVEEHTIRPVLEARLLGRHDALSGQQMHAASGPSTWSSCTAPSGCW